MVPKPIEIQAQRFIMSDSSRLRPPHNGHGPILQKGADKCAVYLQAAVVADEAFLLEQIHKFTDSCAGGSDHLREGCLAHLQGVLWL